MSEEDQWSPARGRRAWYRSVRFVEAWSEIGAIPISGDHHPRVRHDEKLAADERRMVGR